MIEKQAVRIHNVVMLISIFVGVALLILTQSYFFGAFILPDSGYYLRLAEALRNGSRSYVDMISGSWEKQNYFAVWPIGYPVMIAFIALITNTEIYLASKIVSVIILLILFALFYIRFKNHAWLYALITINYGFLHFFYVTCSEQPFILGLIWLSFTLVDILKSEKVKYVHYISLGFASLFLFLSRYIGVFSVGAIGLTAVYQVYACISERRGGGEYYREKIKKAVLLFITAGICATVMALYFLNNYKNSGHITGMSRDLISNKNLLSHLFETFQLVCKMNLEELRNVFFLFFNMHPRTAFILYVMGAVLCCRFLYLKRGSFDSFYKNIPSDGFFFVAIGILYLFSIIFLWFLGNAHAQIHYGSPAFMLFFLGIIAAMCRYRSNMIEKTANNVYGWFFSIFILASLGLYAARPVLKQEPLRGYNEIRTEVLNDLSVVPPQSLIITIGFGFKGMYAVFMRPDSLTIPGYWWRPKEGMVVASLIEKTEGEVYFYYPDWPRVEGEPKDAIQSFISKYGNDHTKEISEKLIRLK